MVKVKGLIAAAVAMGTVITAVPASAADLDGIPWITVSSWAYADVSSFRSAVELPDAMSGVADYTQPVTRVQTAELLYATLVSAGEMYDYIQSDSYPGRYEDTDNKVAGVLKDYELMLGEVIGNDENGGTLYNFYPDRPLTREELAAILCRTARCFYPELLNGGARRDFGAADIADYDDISDYAKDDVADVMAAELMKGMDDGTFAPKDNLTIEQAVVTFYRLFQQLPMTPGADGASLPDGQTFTVRTFENGVIEERSGSTLYLKRGGVTLMEFETDIYENVFCADNGGVTYAAAENIYDRADIYNADTKELLFRIPYPVYDAQSDYIITKSSDAGECTFGLYGYDGNEVLEPKYSLNEIDILKANNFTFPVEEKAEAEGWIYYADKNDSGHMYKMDSNGENVQKLSDNDCFDIEYVNGWLYYSVHGADENELYAMRADGKYEQRLTDETAGVIKSGAWSIAPGKQITSGNLIINGADLGRIIAPYFDGEWVYYLEAVNEYKTLGNLWRVRFNADGRAVKEKVSDEKFSCDNLHVSSAGEKIQQNNGRLYCLNSSGDKLYIFGGGDEKVIEENVNTFGFYGEKLVITTVTGKDENGIIVPEYHIAEPDGSDMRIWREWHDANDKKPEVKQDTETGEKTYEREGRDYGSFRIIEKGVLVPHNDGAAGRVAGLAIRRPDGEETLITDEWNGGDVVNIGGVLYYAKRETVNDRVNGALWAYDVNTGSDTRIAGNVRGVAYGSIAEEIGKWVLYKDNIGNIWRYSIADKKLSEVYPNANLKKYGTLAGWFGGVLSKIDTDGDFAVISDAAAMYAIYVPDGSPVDVTP